MTETAVFGAPWDQRLTAITIVTSILMLGAAALVIWMAVTRDPSPGLRAVLLSAAAIPLLGFILGVLLAPRGYAMDGHHLVIHRLIRPIEIPLRSIRSVEPIQETHLAGTSRTLGSGGFFGYYGRFRNQTLGDFRMYATRGVGYVLVQADEPYVLTPDVPDSFIVAVNRGRGAEGGDRSGAPRDAR